MKAIAYCRVASGTEVEASNALKAQESACKDHARLNGIELVKVFSEQGSGQSLERPRFRKLIQYIARHKKNISTVIVSSCDRITRNFRDLQWFSNFLQKQGIRLQSISQNEETPLMQFAIEIRKAFDNYERAMRSDRIKAGLRKKREKSQ